MARVKNSVFYADRIWWLDELRGLAVIAMVIYHTLYDLVYIFDVPVPMFSSAGMRIFQISIGSTFILLSGLSSQLSRSNLRRGLGCLVLAGLFTAVTMRFMPAQRIMFGVLHFLGAAMVIFHLLRRPLGRLSPAVGTALFALLFAVTYELVYRPFPLPFSVCELLPQSFTAAIAPALPFLFPLGITTPAFYSADYYPIFPWIFLFFIGTLLGRVLFGSRYGRWAHRPHLRPLAAVGQHSLIIYVLHQPIIYGLLTLFFRFYRG